MQVDAGTRPEHKTLPSILSHLYSVYNARLSAFLLSLEISPGMYEVHESGMISSDIIPIPAQLPPFRSLPRYSHGIANGVAQKPLTTRRSNHPCRSRNVCPSSQDFNLTALLNSGTSH